jgi:hypothetical protein
MNRSFGENIFKSENILIFENFLALDGVVQEFCENIIGVVSHGFSLVL